MDCQLQWRCHLGEVGGAIDQSKDQKMYGLHILREHTAFFLSFYEERMYRQVGLKQDIFPLGSRYALQGCAGAVLNGIGSTVISPWRPFHFEDESEVTNDNGLKPQNGTYQEMNVREPVNNLLSSRNSRDTKMKS